MKTVSNDTRQILIKILIAVKDNPDPYAEHVGMSLMEEQILNIVLNALGVPSGCLQQLTASYREEFFQRWLKTPSNEASIVKYLDWATEQLSSTLQFN
jgi:hypothetical protein